MECSHRDPESPHESESSTVLDSGFRAVDSRFQVPDSSICQQPKSGFQSLVEFRDSLSCIPKIQDFSGFRIPQAKISRIPSVILVNRIWFSQYSSASIKYITSADQERIVHSLSLIIYFHSSNRQDSFVEGNNQSPIN